LIKVIPIIKRGKIPIIEAIQVFWSFLILKQITITIQVLKVWCILNTNSRKSFEFLIESDLIGCDITLLTIVVNNTDSLFIYKVNIMMYSYIIIIEF
jgi:hypothetical protein